MEMQKAVHLARLLQERAAVLQTPAERRQQTELDRMIRCPQDKATLIQMTDQAFRAQHPERVVDQLTHILDVQGIPRFFSMMDRTLLRGFQSFGSYLPGVAVPMVKDKMRHETANVILPAERDMLTAHLNARRAEGVRMNVNLLGEAILSEQEARRRLESYLAALQMPEIEVVSVKISTIFSQISPLAREHTVTTIADRMELLYRAAAKFRFERADGTAVPKFVYMDMEEYRDMDLTAKAFMQALDRPGLEDIRAGIVLQAYIPDAYRVQQGLNDWARRRVAAGGAPVTLRIVKGANMEMECVEASLRAWPQATYKVKLHTDANFKRMLLEGMKPENLAAVRLGVASHNLFELAYGIVLAGESGSLDCVQFEMLEGMANHQRRALFELTKNLLLYAPACKKKDFLNAIGYLVRRLDENTGPDNFLAHAFKIHVGSPDWQRLEQQFVESYNEIPNVSDAPCRSQDRNAPVVRVDDDGRPWQEYQGEPDTDFALPQNSRWGGEILNRWHDRCNDRATQVPLHIAGREISDPREVHQSLDPSRPGVVVARYLEPNLTDVNDAVACARADEDGWRAMSHDQRSTILRQVAHEIRCARGDLMGAALAEAGKTLMESDPEVSEAIDFIDFYTKTAGFYHGQERGTGPIRAEHPSGRSGTLDLSPGSLDGVQAHGKGVVAVIPPWNFPIAIPCGGVVSSLAAGNTVILKPAPDTVLVAYLLCECFWRAGVSRRTLQMLPGDAEVGQPLATHPDVDVVIFTGGTETAFHLLRQKPSMNLLAETGGKNATIVTALSDRDLAIKNILHSAFSHSGQKCSATSLLILEGEVFEDEDFKRVLCEAVQSIPTGSAWKLHHKMGPLIRPPAGKLEQGLKELEAGESWAVMPRFDEENPQLVWPSIKWGVQPGSFTHMTELFGPVLGVMKAKDLHEAVSLVNATGYGLTSGLESLDDREQTYWREHIRAGNLYINRPTTGAIVLRQPFGGMGKSAFGPGIKAGGPNYVAQLMDFTPIGRPAGDQQLSDPQLADLRVHIEQLANEPGDWSAEELLQVLAAMGSYNLWMQEEFGKDHDHFRLVGQDNLRRYVPVEHLRIRIDRRDSLFDILGRVCAAKAAGCRITVSRPPDLDQPLVDRLEQWTESWAAAIEFVEETDASLAAVISSRQTDRVRYAAPDRVPAIVQQAVAETGQYVAATPVLPVGRIELLWYLREQSLCIDYHRYGNLGVRVEEQRSEVL
jgi:RHH-type proline utilization regulon transcriptional repressor/proline dehydrogenase/delta 1-pyrroline-5-carboxylate dehydrogenase